MKRSQAPVPTVPRHVLWSMIVALTVGLIFVWPYLSSVFFSALIAFIFYPVYKFILRRSNRQWFAIPATLVVATLSVILPLIFVVGVVVAQANSLISDIQSNTSGSAQVEDVVARGTERVNALLTALPGGENVQIDTEQIFDTIKQAAVNLIQALVDLIKSAGGAFIGLISTLILVYFLVASMLRYHDQLIAFIKKLSPYQENITSLYLGQAGAMTTAMVKGQMLIALAQGFASAFSLWLVGVDYFWFFAVVLSFLSFIPLGAGIVTIPIGIIILLTGNVAQGLFVILFHMLIVSSIDNFLRPQLVPKSARLDSALTLLAVFCGIALWGAIGVIYGPVLMIVLLITFRIYADHNVIAKSGMPSKLV